MKHLISRLAIATFLILAGLILPELAGKSVVSLAQNSTYSTTWTADPLKLLKASATFTSGTTFTGEAIFGVWRWTVKGALNGTSYRESWNAPPLTSTDSNVINLVPRLSPDQEGCNVPTTYDSAKILVGCITSNKSIGGVNTANYKITSDTSVNYHFKSRYNQGSGVNRATSCIDSPRNGGESECIVATGPYSFSHFHEPGSNSSFRWLGAVMVMPLEWTVSGRLCQGVADPNSCPAP